PSRQAPPPFPTGRHLFSTRQTAAGRKLLSRLVGTRSAGHRYPRTSRSKLAAPEKAGRGTPPPRRRDRRKSETRLRLLSYGFGRNAECVGRERRGIEYLEAGD